MNRHDSAPLNVTFASMDEGQPRRRERRTFSRALAAALLAAILLVDPARSQPSKQPGAAEPDANGVPARKQSSLGLYTLSHLVPSLMERLGGRTKVLFLDVRTRAEAQFVGMPDDADALVPYMEFPEFLSWDDKANHYKVEPNARFADEVRHRLAQKALDRDAPIILICRSGDRSAKAVELLKQLGHDRVWTVVDGFEGDMSPQGRRDVNGWKNAGLPWSYKLVKAKMPLAG